MRTLKKKKKVQYVENNKMARINTLKKREGIT